MVERLDALNVLQRCGTNTGFFVRFEDYASLESRVAELEKDAARYRWVMDCDDFEAVIEALSLGSDDAIDRAMSREA